MTPREFVKRVRELVAEQRADIDGTLCGQDLVETLGEMLDLVK